MPSNETLREVSLADRFDLSKPNVLLSGTQALVRVALMQRARDAAAGRNTAGYVSGYRGSPLGTVDAAFEKARALLDPAQIRFQAGLNEDLAATAHWGAQQAELRGEGKYDGVFGLWYGKGPGVDRSGDVLRHANLTGTSPLGGVLVAAGDDHTCESSTTCHQSELALIDAMIPILSPAGLQELLDYSIHGWALSRYSGCWVGLKSVKDTIEATAVVDGDPFRVETRIPDGDLAQACNIRLGDTPQEQEARLHLQKIPAAQAYARANGLDRRMHGSKRARIGIVSSGKSWLDLAHAFDLLGLDDDALHQMEITTYKVGMVWPLDPVAFGDWAAGLDDVIVVEEKRPVLEPQVREIVPAGMRVLGSRDPEGAPLFRSVLDLDPASIALGLVQALDQIGTDTSQLEGHSKRLCSLMQASMAPDLTDRKPWFCAGCPHSTSTRLPDGARAYAGIGCHYMAQWMDRETSGYTHMGGEGANWIGEALFSKRTHVFQNMGDGTYNHSGNQAIRAAVYAGTNITYKILYNDAVAMTGGQTHEGSMTPYQIAAELLAFGVRKVVAVVDEKEQTPALPSQVKSQPRSKLQAVQEDLQRTEGVSAIIYVQTCAAEKRRRRKRGKFPNPDKRVFINPAVCEGCGDCGQASNCVAILPLETPFGRKRQIDQSACNKDFSCLKGFCPSFVTVSGVNPKASVANFADIPDLPEPELPELDRVWNMLITGIGGTGVVTIGALMTMAAHLEGKGAAELQMAGLAQKGGAVSIHCRIAPNPADIKATRLATGEADAVIAGDLVVAAGGKALSLMELGRTRIIANAATAMTGQFTLDPGFQMPGQELSQRIKERVGADAVTLFDASSVARDHLGDTMYSNVLLLGAAWQAGQVPLGRAAIRRAIELNGASVEGNLRAFETGRWCYLQTSEAVVAPEPTPETAQQRIDRLADFLVGYQDPSLKARFLNMVARARQAETSQGLTGFTEAVADGYWKLLSYKDEYEVARLHMQELNTLFDENASSVKRLTFHLAPPLLSRTGKDGRPMKSEFGPWVRHVFRLLARMKRLRGTPFDIFGYTAERRHERRLIREFEQDIEQVMPILSVETISDAIALARLPETIRGFGHVKQRNAGHASKQKAQLLERMGLLTARGSQT
ncbi:indolepyruvate ferredoxin oxidoreductase family protein [Roseovarius sp. 2305UL8-3]|uniref:indolepyruvate ferredoxin oxidoreductase family protein n=1 Tax=Roseovarius conchicola TaxID=3121636 RepID=UPI003527B834